jgi:hypothetical protein
MENNVIEFKYDKVIEYFENFKQKYADNYEENKIKGTKIVKDYYSLILSPIFLAGCVGVFFFDSNLSNYNISGARLIDIHRLLITWVLPTLAIISVALLMKSFIDFMHGGHEVQIEYTKKSIIAKLNQQCLMI